MLLHVWMHHKQANCSVSGDCMKACSQLAEAVCAAQADQPLLWCMWWCEVGVSSDQGKWHARQSRGQIYSEPADGTSVQTSFLQVAACEQLIGGCTESLQQSSWRKLLCWRDIDRRCVWAAVGRFTPPVHSPPAGPLTDHWRWQDVEVLPAKVIAQEEEALVRPCSREHHLSQLWRPVQRGHRWRSGLGSVSLYRGDQARQNQLPFWKSAWRRDSHGSEWQASCRAHTAGCVHSYQTIGRSSLAENSESR